jgi:regulatory protein
MPFRNRIAKARRPDDPDSARYRALRLLERRPQSISEMRRKLKDRGFTAEAVHQVVEKLKDTGLLNDEQYAKNFVSLRASMKPEGRRLLVSKLMAHGVVRELAMAAVDETLEGKDEGELAEEAATRWAKRYRGRKLDERLRKRLEGHLIRRGFGWNSVSKAMRKVGAEMEEKD